MSKLEEFRIVIQDEKKVYYPGEVVRGEVILDLKAEMEIVGISLEFCGLVKTSWQDVTGGEKKIITGEEVLFRNTSLFCGHLPTEHRPGSILHSEGAWNYQYTFTFPNILPTSYEGSYGSIRYFLKAHIRKPGSKLDIITKLPLTVIDKTDTMEPVYANKREDDIMKTTGCACLKSGQLFLNAEINRGCYLPGENILFNVKVSNQSKRKMAAIKAKIIQYVDYFSSDVIDRKTVQKELIKIKGPPVQRGQMFIWDGQRLKIPITSPTIQNCQLISVKYVLQVYLDVPCATDVTIPFDVTIGTIPGHVKDDEIHHSYKSIPDCCPVSFHDDQEEVYKITHEVEYLPIYPYIQVVEGKRKIAAV